MPGNPFCSADAGACLVTRLSVYPWETGYQWLLGQDTVAFRLVCGASAQRAPGRPACCRATMVVLAQELRGSRPQKRMGLAAVRARNRSHRVLPIGCLARPIQVPMREQEIDPVGIVQDVPWSRAMPRKSRSFSVGSHPHFGLCVSPVRAPKPLDQVLQALCEAAARPNTILTLSSHCLWILPPSVSCRSAHEASY